MPRIVIAGRERLDELRPLWLELHHHHARVSRVQPFVDDETSWAARRRSYVETFDAGGFALVAEDDDGLAGYALLDEVDAELARRGIRDLMIGVMEGNDDARRLYERRGLVPGWRQLYRLAAAER
jgi:GNAT superfamily N-acetyltransferase